MRLLTFVSRHSISQTKAPCRDGLKSDGGAQRAQRDSELRTVMEESLRRAEGEHVYSAEASEKTPYPWNPFLR
jgi:hypothetical protein